MITFIINMYGINQRNACIISTWKYTVFAKINAPHAEFFEAIKRFQTPSKPIGFMYSPLWKITHQSPSVLCTPPFENHPSKPIGFVYSPLWKITVFGECLFRGGRLFRQIRYTNDEKNFYKIGNGWHYRCPLHPKLVHYVLRVLCTVIFIKSRPKNCLLKLTQRMTSKLNTSPSRNLKQTSRNTKSTLIKTFVIERSEFLSKENRHVDKIAVQEDDFRLRSPELRGQRHCWEHFSNARKKL